MGWRREGGGTTGCGFPPQAGNGARSTEAAPEEAVAGTGAAPLSFAAASRQAITAVRRDDTV